MITRFKIKWDTCNYWTGCVPLKDVSMARKCHNLTPQTNSRHRGEEANNNTSNITPIMRPALSLSLPQRDDCKTRKDTHSTEQQNKDQHKLSKTMGATINTGQRNHRLRTDSSRSHRWA